MGSGGFRRYNTTAIGQKRAPRTRPDISAAPFTIFCWQTENKYRDGQMNRFTIICGFAFAMLSTATFAQNPRCLQDGTSHDSLRCEEDKLNESEQHLNAAYTQLLTHLKGSPARDGLIRAQRAWIEFRDLDCDAIYKLRPRSELTILVPNELPP